MLEIKDLCFFFVQNQKFFENLDIKLNKASILWVYWPSWCGKTTFLKTIGALMQPKKWKIFYNKENIFELSSNQISKYRNQTIWFAFQEFNLIEWFSASENINMYFYFSNLVKDKKREQYLTKFLEIENLLYKDIENLSWWEKERVNIVKALIHKPSIVLMDEPTSYLDQRNSEKIYQLIKEYSQDNICIFASHEKESQNYLELEKFKENKKLSFFKNKRIENVE